MEKMQVKKIRCPICNHDDYFSINEIQKRCNDCYYIFNVDNTIRSKKSHFCFRWCIGFKEHKGKNIHNNEMISCQNCGGNELLKNYEEKNKEIIKS